jgi:hypothetical protein
VVGTKLTQVCCCWCCVEQVLIMTLALLLTASILVWRQYFANSKAFIFVVDSNDRWEPPKHPQKKLLCNDFVLYRERLGEARDEIERFFITEGKQVPGMFYLVLFTHSLTDFVFLCVGKPLLVFANRQDLPNALLPGKIIYFYAQQVLIHCFGCYRWDSWRVGIGLAGLSTMAHNWLLCHHRWRALWGLWLAG